MKTNINGIQVEIDGVDEDDLPPEFDMDEVIRWTNEGKSIEEMETRIQSKSWNQTERRKEFWNKWFDHDP